MAKSVLLIYTGGTIGMVADPVSGRLMPFDFSHLKDMVPELGRLEINLVGEAFDPPVDSSDITLTHWRQMAQLVHDRYNDYDGFVILHGTDTMSYTASALSFMFENLAKPVILTGSQLPIGVLRTDGKENLITAIQLAALEKQGAPVIQEVAIYFGSSLYRGNRTQKYSAEDFNAFKSPNLRALAEAGIHLQFKNDLLLRPSAGCSFSMNPGLASEVAVLRLFPGISGKVVEAVCNAPGLRGLILESFGSGNGPTAQWFIDVLQKARARGLVIVNVTQCATGFVEQGRYAASASFQQLGIISGGDMTTEAAVTKLMHVLHMHHTQDDIEREMLRSLRGELTTYSSLV